MHAELLINGFFIGGPCDSSVGKDVIRSPYDGSIVGTCAEGGLSEARTAVACAHGAFEGWRTNSPQVRGALLRRVAALVRERAGELAELLCDEVGKPISLAEAEVARTAITFDLAANLALSLGPQAHDLSYDPRGPGCAARVERFPVGVIFAIVPYNWPLNLAAHKIAPALAAGNCLVVKPSGQAPLSTLSLCRIVHEAGCPPGVLNAVHMPAPIAERALEDPRIAMLSFTGSPAVGWKLKQKLWDRKVSLELGGDASALVFEDADLDQAISKLVSGSFAYAGQICISIQHIRVHRSRLDEVRERLVEATAACPFGDPRQRETVCGPLISAQAADKVMDWVAEAQAAGATLLRGGIRSGNVISPTLLVNVPASTRLGCEEVFGPIATLSAFDEDDDAVRAVNASKYGIHCGVFTHDRPRVSRLYRDLQVGGVVVNDAPTLRFDGLPYGGTKQSGFGREGVFDAYLEMSEPKTLVQRMR